jgi:hypothetical protein
MLFFSYKRRFIAPVSVQVIQTIPIVPTPTPTPIFGSMFSRAQYVSCSSCPGAK